MGRVRYLHGDLEHLAGVAGAAEARGSVRLASRGPSERTAAHRRPLAPDRVPSAHACAAYRPQTGAIACDRSQPIAPQSADSLDNIPAYASEVALLERMAGRQGADALRAPFVLGDRKDLATLFSKAGVASAQVTTHRGTARFPSIRTMVEADLRGWLPVMGVILSEDQIDRILQEARQALSSYATADGEVTFHLSAHLVTAKDAS